MDSIAPFTLDYIELSHNSLDKSKNFFVKRNGSKFDRGVSQQCSIRSHSLGTTSNQSKPHTALQMTHIASVFKSSKGKKTASELGSKRG